VSEILEHGWIAQYRKSKRQREWGILGASDSEEE
jgi:hypothetical protein